jgi:hypothetical protein
MEPALSRWADSDYMAALTVDYLASLTWILQAVYSKDGARRPHPKPMWRPTDDSPDAVNAVDALAAYDELMVTIERQTGAPRGIAPAEAP